MKSFLRKKVPGFTLLEMLVVLFIISVLLIVFLPNITEHYQKVNDTGNKAIDTLIKNQQQLCFLTKGEHGKGDFNGIESPDKIPLATLVKHEHITEEQKDRYEATKNN